MFARLMTLVGSSHAAAVTLVGAALLGGCARSAADPDFPEAPIAPMPAPTEAARIENILCSIPIEKSRMSLDQAMQRYGVPGVSAAAMVGGRVIWSRGWGYADRERRVPMTPQTILQAASISKAISSVGILRMAQAGELNLDEDVSDSIDWEAKWQGRHAKVTLRQLLSHSAGLSVHGFNGYDRKRSDSLPTTLDVLEGKGNSPPVVLEAPPGARTQYSGGGFTVAQAVVEERVESPFSAAMYEWLIKPFGLRRSTYEQPLSEDKRAFAAHGYRKGQPVGGGFHVYPEEAAAGLWTTPSDLLTVASGLIRAYHGLPAPLSRGMAFMMLTPTSVDGKFGIGWVVKNRGQAIEAQHIGGNAGFTSMLIWDTRGNGAAVLVNGEGPIASALATAIGEEYGWRHGKTHGCAK